MTEYVTSETQKDTKEVKQITESTEPSPVTIPKHHKVLLLASLLLVFLLLMSAAFVAGRHSWLPRDYAQTSRLQAYGQRPGAKMDEPSGSGFRGGMMRGDLSENGSMNNTRVNGVVTTISGDTITIAGNGTTTKVLVSSNTTYSGDAQPTKVNDTIMALGAKNGDGSLVASNVYLVRQ